MGKRNRRRGGDENPGPEPTEPHRENVPGEWDHSSGEEEVFEAGLVSGAAGEESEVSEAELDRQAQEATGRPAVRATAKGAAPGQATSGGGLRIFQFFRASWAELQRVQWPDRRQVAQATAVVLGFVVIAGAYLGLADAAAQKFIDFIL
jgi:preprotein translocase subunit SecE